MERFFRHNSSLIGGKNQAKFENDCISRSGHRFKIAQPNLMNWYHSLLRKMLSTFLRFLIRDANSCIDCQPHKRCPRYAINASIHLTHSFAFSAFFTRSFSLYSRVWKWPKSETKFWKECIKAQQKKLRHLCHQNHTHKIVHSSDMYYQNLNVIHEPSKNDEKCKMYFNT